MANGSTMPKRLLSVAPSASALSLCRNSRPSSSIRATRLITTVDGSYGCLAHTTSDALAGRSVAAKTTCPGARHGSIDSPTTRKRRRRRSTHRANSAAPATGRGDWCIRRKRNERPAAGRALVDRSVDRSTQLAVTQASSRPLLAQNMWWISSTAARSFSATSTEQCTLASEQSLAAFQNVVWRSGNCSRCGGLK